MSLTDATSLNLGELSNMERALKSNKQLATAIDKTVNDYQTVDISMVMTNLGNVFDTLKKEYEDIKSFPCSTITLKTILHNQTLINNSYVTSSLFVCACLKALQLHKIALVMAEKGKMDSSIMILEKCADLAKTMADECEKIKKEATDLCNLSEEALHAAQNDEYMLRGERERNKRKMTDAKMRHAEMEAQTKQLYEQIEINNKKMVDDARHEILKQKAAESRKEEKEIYAYIAKFDEILKFDNCKIWQAEVLIKSLGMVNTPFEHLKQFWNGVENHCKALTNVSELQLMNDPVFKDEIIDELKMSGLSWLTLGKINYSAQLSISDVDKRTDNILSNLPTKLEALEIVKNDADSIISSLKKEVSAIE